MFRAYVLIIRRSKMHYTGSGVMHETATYSRDGTTGCVMQFWPPDDDEHMCSKHVEAWNKTYCKIKFCASSWLNTEINKCHTKFTVRNLVFQFVPIQLHTYRKSLHFENCLLLKTESAKLVCPSRSKIWCSWRAFRSISTKRFQRNFSVL